MSELTWREALLALIPVAVLAAVFSAPPVAQPQQYHLFADGRGVLGVPNLGNVVSNLAFLAAGWVGLFQCMTAHMRGARMAWTVFFAGAVLVSIGSAYYHWQPSDRTLVWDRLPMTVGFMGAYVALLSDYAGRRLETLLILPAVAAGLASVVYWAIADDLRLYFAVQGTVFATIIVLIAAFPHPPRQRGYLIAGIGLYALALACEQFDREVFDLLAGVASGHTIKHLLAACAIFTIGLMLRDRGRRQRHHHSRPAGDAPA